MPAVYLVLALSLPSDHHFETSQSPERRPEENTEASPSKSPGTRPSRDWSQWLGNLVRGLAGGNRSPQWERDPFATTPAMEQLSRPAAREATPSGLVLRGTIDNGKRRIALVEVAGRTWTLSEGEPLNLELGGSMQPLTVSRIGHSTLELKTQSGATVTHR